MKYGIGIVDIGRDIVELTIEFCYCSVNGTIYISLHLEIYCNKNVFHLLC